MYRRKKFPKLEISKDFKEGKGKMEKRSNKGRKKGKKTCFQATYLSKSMNPCCESALALPINRTLMAD